MENKSMTVEEQYAFIKNTARKYKLSPPNGGEWTKDRLPITDWGHWYHQSFCVLGDFLDEVLPVCPNYEEFKGYGMGATILLIKKNDQQTI